MGNGFSCPCSHSCNRGNPREVVMVMRSDGSFLQFKRGTHAKEVAGAHPGYRVVRCDADRTVLWGSAELDCSRLHFLVPEEKVRCPDTYGLYWRAAEAKGLMPPRPRLSGGGLWECSAEFRRPPWTPQLRTIPEVLSPPVAVQVMESSSPAA